MEIPANYRRLEDTERRPARGARLIGPADPAEVLSVSIRVRRRPDAPPLPDQRHWASTPVKERKFISRQDFAAQYGAQQADLDLVADFATAHGLKVVETSVARRTVVVSGTVAQMSEAFAVELGRYESPKGTYRGREGFVYMPAEVADVVEGVFGLDNRQMARPALTLSGGGSGATPLTPPQVAKLYNFPASLDPTGQSIGLLEFGGGYQTSDIQAFFSGLGLPVPALTDVSVDGVTNSPGSGADLEVALDIDVAGSVAQGANIAVYFAPYTEQGWIDIVTTAVFDFTNAPSVLSISWGHPELEATVQGQNWPFQWTRAAIRAVSTTFLEAAALGLTVFAASGDSGTDCYEGDGLAHVLYPASDPWVTACGGTIINASGASFIEDTWNDSGATGGGISSVNALPFWQLEANIPPSVNDGHRGRGIPDIAGNASPNSGYLIQVGGVTYQVGGTSAVAPLYAGLVALLSADPSLFGPLGYLNPLFYVFGGTNMFRDIADGVNNQWSGETAPAPYYVSTPGWNACTGWGVIDGNALLTALTLLFP